MIRKLVGVVVILLMMTSSIPGIEADYSKSLFYDIVYVDDDYTESTPGWQVDHFDTIQDGITFVDEFGTVYVYNGVYEENVQIDKSIDLIGEDRNNTIIDGNGTANVIYISENADEVTLKHLSIRNSGNVWEDAGISIQSMNNTISENNIFHNNHGIYIDRASNNEMSDNQIRDNTRNGIFIQMASNNNNVISNSIENNGKNGLQIANFVSENRISENIINNNDEAGIKLYWYANDNIIIKNDIIDNDYGIEILVGEFACGGNFIHQNNFIDNTINAYDECGSIWYSVYPYGGNYWNNFDEPSEGAYDNNSDGFVDSLYLIPGCFDNQDQYPFINRNGWVLDGIPDPPIISGPIAAGLEIDLDFTAVASDPEEDQLYYLWNWGDGNSSEWLGPYESGENMTTNYSWINEGEYQIKVKVKDATGNESEWSEPHNISIAPQIDISNIQLGYIYLRTFFTNDSYAYIYLLETFGVAAVLSDKGLFVEAMATDAVDSVTFELIDLLWEDQINQDDDNSSDGFSADYEISSGLFQITIYAYNENGTLIDRDRLDYLIFIDLTSGDESQHVSPIGKIRQRLRARLRARIL